MVLTVTAVLLILACLEMNSVKASLWDLHLFICKGPQTNTRFQAKSCFQSHKVLFAICPRTSKLSTTLPFFLSVPIAWYKPFCWQIYQVLTWTFFRETDFSLVHFHNFRRVFFFFFSFFFFLSFSFLFEWGCLLQVGTFADPLHRWMGGVCWTDS